MLFNGGEGSDALHTLKTKDTDLPSLRSELDRHGIEYRTLIPHPDHTTVMVYDKGGQLTKNMETFARSQNAPLHTDLGRGELVGDPEGLSRPKARHAYRQAISEYESKAGYSPPAGPAGKTQSPGGGVIERGMYYPAGQFTPKPY